MDSGYPGPPSAVTFQPEIPGPPVYAAPGSEGGPVQIRKMEAQDVDFVSRMLVEAFRGKFVHAVGENRIEAFTQQNSAMLSRSQRIWHRYYIALYDGRLAGAIAIKFHGDSAEEDFQCGDACSRLGCRGTCGLVCLGCAVTEDSIRSKECYIDHIGVDAHYRGKGIGKVLMERADFEARQRGCTTMFLWVKQSNRAVHLYERQGYAIVERVNGSWFTQCAVGNADWYKMQKTL